ncbi:MAG: hypothetical protein FWE07_08730 [Turicibacter sp.]|nr:hypothetical protein [Turicibacter sp.]
MFETKKSQKYYKIQNVQELPAFYMNIATSSDMWVYLSSHGALTAGRGNAGNSLFPYETDDKLHLATSTGPKTVVRFADGNVWEPFNVGFDNPYHIARNLYKRNTGDALLFEEYNLDLKLCFSYLWETSEKYGLVRTSEVTNLGAATLKFDILDGVENIMPHGIDPFMASNLSCLTDAYKACEKYGDRLAIYSLTSSLGDTAEPIEVLLANVAWQTGNATTLLSSRQVADFARGLPIENEEHAVGRKGAFFVHHSCDLEAEAAESWMMVMDSRKNQKDVVALATEIEGLSTEALRARVEADVKKGTDELVRVVAVADGLQHTANETTTVRHYMSTLYNNMRGGVFLDGYTIDPQQFIHLVNVHDKGLAKRQAAFLKDLSGVTTILELHKKAEENGDPDLIRLSLEFLPLTFSRRHGDPSRPWNHFNIRVKDEEGNRVYAYEGNWRDIFQNWEAMGRSFPAYIAPMITKFLNASTPDGFNPYRINQDGIDWEVPPANAPTTGIGYWGDHQIVYLTKLLEWLKAYSPEDVHKLITSDIFTYANIPYEILPYETFFKDSKHTIRFDFDKHDAIMKHVETFGTDARLVMKDDAIYRVSFVEKLLVPILAKLSNLVPGGGIWMNTHRPEWNDANNAIVGNGLSMVTVYQLYRHLNFCLELLASLEGLDLMFSKEVKAWFQNIADVIARSDQLSPHAFLDEAGAAFSDYRGTIYSQGFSVKETLHVAEVKAFLTNAVALLAQTIDANKRPDGMYHAYNILTLTDESLKVDHLFLMLEGQSAVLGSGRLNADEALTLVKAMEASDLMNPELDQFFLYPMKRLNTFMARNIIPANRVADSALITRLLAEDHEGFFFKDAEGLVRFHHGIGQSSDVEKWLVAVGASAEEADVIREIYEEVFAHKQFTGRSGIMYKFEGIGCIFWHQNAKHLLSLQESFMEAHAAEHALTSELKEAYYRLRAGFGFTKTPKQWGAFPLEPYSHTPYKMPAQQQGMTGQAKEDVLLRTSEIGVVVAAGILSFNPSLLKTEEFLAEVDTFNYVNNEGVLMEVSLPEKSLAFTVCRVPVVYHLSDAVGVNVYGAAGEVLYQEASLQLNREWSRKVFDGDAAIARIEVTFPESLIVK